MRNEDIIKKLEYGHISQSQAFLEFCSKTYKEEIEKLFDEIKGSPQELIILLETEIEKARNNKINSRFDILDL